MRCVQQLTRELLRLFHNREAVYVVLAYFDESEQHREALPAASVSALTGTGLQWERFTYAWSKVLDDFEVTDRKGRRIFHSLDFESPEGRIGTSYEQWSESRLKDFNRQLLDVIAGSGIQASAATVIVSEYEDVAQRFVADRSRRDPGFKVFADKFNYCAFWAMLFAGHEAKTYYPKGEEIVYYFENRDSWSFINKLYDMIEGVNDHFRFADRPGFLSKDVAVPLQAADKIAYEASKHASHHRDPNPPIQYTEIIDGERAWKTRYALQHLYLHGLDVKIQHWRKGDLEAFFGL